MDRSIQASLLGAALRGLCLGGGCVPTRRRFGADKRFSLTDCVSFVLMERLGIERALAFDARFVQAGFRILP